MLKRIFQGKSDEVPTGPIIPQKDMNPEKRTYLFRVNNKYTPFILYLNLTFYEKIKWINNKIVKIELENRFYKSYIQPPEEILRQFLKRLFYK